MNYEFSDKLASLKPSAIREIFKSLADPTIISFAAGNPAPESFPVEELAKISADIYEKRPPSGRVKVISLGSSFSRESSIRLHLRR